MDKPAWSPEVIDWLAEDLVAHGYDLKHTMAQIFTSRAYQLPAVNLRETEERYVFRGPAIRRMSAEQFADALHTLTGLAYTKTDAKLNRAAALSLAATTLPLAPQWIWGNANGSTKCAPATYVFRRTVTLAAAPTDAHFEISADDNYAIKINGKAAGSSGKRNSTSADWIDVKSSLHKGANEIEITVANMPPDDGRLASFKTDARPDPDSPAGLLLYAYVRTGDQVADFVSDKNWSTTELVAPSNDRFGKPKAPPPTDVRAAIELGGVDLAPWKFGPAFLDLAAASRDQRPVERASLVNADPLTTALGRPNREQVMTVRQATATTLQALELTNGATLAKLLKQGAEKIVAANATDSTALIAAVYEKSVCRKPTATEQRLALQVVGSPARTEGVEDLLWAVTMLPEFQLIR
jgi:hypothetical protein